MTNWQGWWIWTGQKVAERNAFVRFRRSWRYDGGPAVLHITADSRYVLYVNGAYVGQGPVRAWPAHWRYDTYDLTPYLKRGENVLAVLVQHLGEGNFQYIPAPPGLLAQLELAQETIVSDGAWRASPDPAFISVVPRISVQQGFEEQYDARLADDWTLPGYDDGAWPSAVPLRPADDGWHRDLAPRGIPFLTLEPVLPQRVLSKEAVRSLPHRFTIYAKPYILPEDHLSTIGFAHAYLATQVWSPAEADITFRTPHKHPGPLKVNGQEVKEGRARLRAGWNSLVASLRGAQQQLWEFVVVMEGPPQLRFCATAERPGSPWAVVGPFALSEEERQAQVRHGDPDRILVNPLVPEATCERGEAFWREGDVAQVVHEPFFQPVRPEHLPAADAFVQAYTDQVIDGEVQLAGEESLLSGNGWATVYPLPDGSDVRILLDFGREVIGYHRFEISASAGTVVDLLNFEFITPSGQYHLTEGMNNSARYICREGRQAYQTYVRRGFRYSYLILRNLTRPVHLRRVEVLFSTYPQSRRGEFLSSDAKLSQIWQVGAHTLRCCAEDTYTDCPAYEQTHWVGDARNEALVDWVVNGDPRLWYRCLEQTGQSLDRSPLTESHVPSAWQTILPLWSLLWMRSCREYLLFTGDREGGRRLLRFVERNVDGIAKHLNRQGLFEIRAWNMFDWAAMDTPSAGVVTHQNCMAVGALREGAEMAEWLGEGNLALRWREMADALSQAINAHLWSEEKGAYTDSLRDGQFSPVYSQQTQTAAYISGVATGERARRCLEIMRNPPVGFVRAGSPFFEFFLLEAYQREAEEQALLDTIRRDWGFMIDMGSTTFWELWTLSDLWNAPKDRLTRSYCHGWSAAPTFFLSTYTLGVRPGGPGFRPVIVEPHPGDLLWCRGRMPTPHGDVEVQWENRPGEPFTLRVRAPEGLEVKVRLPREGTATLNGRALPPEARGKLDK